MKQRTKANLAAGAFFCACLIPSLGMLIQPPVRSAANQTLAPPPALTTEEGGLNPAVLQEITDYTADHFALRQQMITANAALEGLIFRTSAEDSVLMGRDGWLFYRETLDGYLHTASMTERQLWSAAHTLALMTEYVQGQGARLVFTAAPNKVSLYPQYLPYVGSPLEGESDVERLLPLLEAEGVTYIDLFAPFRAQEAVLYFRTDSHWNTQGAALAQKSLLEGLGKDFQPFWLERERVVPDSHRGDLYEMVYPTGGGMEWDMEFDRPFTFSYVRPIRSPEDQRIETENPSKTGTLLMFRDSFGNSLFPFLAEEFGRCLFSRPVPYQLTLAEETEADTVLVELVERNLDYLCTQAPVFPAPERWLQGEPPQGTAAAAFTVRDDGQLMEHLHITGTVSGPLDTASPIYVQTEGGLYEATPAGTTETEGEPYQAAPFTLYIPRESGDVTGVLYLENGVLYAARMAPVQE